MRVHNQRVFHTVHVATALNACVERILPPDSVVTIFQDAGFEVPFIHEDAVLGESRTGLLLWAAAARESGFDRFRTVLVHPALALTVPQVAREYSRVVAQAPAVIVAEVAGESRAVLVVHAEGNVDVFPCAHVPFAPLGMRSVPEAVRHLRDVVMQGLSLVERGIADEFRNLPWRDWQEEFAGEHRRAGSFFMDSTVEAACFSAVDIHCALRPVLAPLAVEPQELGSLLAQLHTAAHDVVTTTTRESAAQIR